MIPKKFELAGTTWKVLETEHLVNCGQCHVNEATIKLDKKLPTDVKEQSFLHELVHAILYTMGDNTEHDEKFVDAMAHMLHQYLKTCK